MDLTKCVIGIELGSTRIKAVLLDENNNIIASGGHGWENKFENGIWTYSIEDIHGGIQACYKDLKKDDKEKFGITITTVGAMGVSAMMHGYMPLDKDDNLLTPFRTWRNRITPEASAELTELFDFNIPQRWTISHIYQAILNKEDHVKDIAYLPSLPGYTHYLLTGKKVTGICEASAMLAADSDTNDYDQGMCDKFDALVASKGYDIKIRDIFPKVLVAGEDAGSLTPEGAKFLDPEGDLQPGIPFCPPEADAGTGMVATNSVRVHTGSISAGTSDFVLIVLDKKLKRHREVDVVSTPAGSNVALVQCNNCTSDINAWVQLFSEFAEAVGADCNKEKLYPLLFKKALEGEVDAGGLISYNYFSGEGVTDIANGCPLFVRRPDSNFTLANFMRMNLMSAIATLKIGIDILKQEEVKIASLYAHGGYFKTPEVGQRILSAAVNAPVSVMESAGEGGAYGMALLAAYMLRKEPGETLEDFLDNKVFATAKTSVVMADPSEVEGFERFTENYKKAFPAERTAVEALYC